ncbi:protein sel-1 homolog 2 isoform X3 [Erythrolamprus reginae]|uniref:protein sel-1 homolog 2 isoform X3 n=1 Tax=Erythrolamprus reginae TaxID=121349 RepID=UPI00396CDCF3
MKTQFLVLCLMHFWIAVSKTEDNPDDQREDDFSEEELLNIIQRGLMLLRKVSFPSQEDVGKKKSISQSSQKILGRLKNGKDKVENHQRHLGAAEKQSQKVMEQLAADMLFGYNGPQNVKAAVSLYKLLAEEGSHRSQTALGFLSSYGIGVEYNQAKALVYYTFASIGGNLVSQMIMGYRYRLGINVPMNCEAALNNYKKVAKFVANELEKNEDIPVERVNLMPENLSNNEEFVDWDLHQYLKFLAERGNTKIQLYLGQLHLFGRRGLEKDHAKAFYYFLKAANAGNANGMAFIGKMYLKGSTVVTQSNIMALKFFTMAANKGNSIGLWGLGILSLKGRGVPLNYTGAFQYFQKAAEKGYDNAQFQLGVMYYDGLEVRRDFKLAYKYFYLAFENGHLLAMYYLAHMYAKGTGVFKSCQNAVELYKTVCELGGWSEMFRTAYFAYQAGNIDSSLAQYAYLAEMGYEEAQINSVYIMESEKVKLLHRNQVYPLALLLLKQAASQGNAFAKVKIGDYYFYGFGTTKDYVSAITYYTLAANQLNAEAMFNLAYMHENGLGVPQLTAVWKLTAFDGLPKVHWDLFIITFMLALMILLRANQQN